MPAAQREFWEKRDPVTTYENYLTAQKILDTKSKKEIEDKSPHFSKKTREFAENSPMPPPEFANEGVYCTGDDCHKIRPQWKRPLAEVTPPKCSVKAVWNVEGFGSGEIFRGEQAPIHFGDTSPTIEKNRAGKRHAG